MSGGDGAEPIIEKPSQVTEVHAAVVVKVGAAAVTGLVAILAVPLCGQE